MASQARRLRRGIMSPIFTQIRRIDFARLVRWVLTTPEGRADIERWPLVRPSLRDGAIEELVQRTTDLAGATLAGRGFEIDRARLEAHARDIACTYDMDMHRALTGVTLTISRHMFEHADNDHMYTSPDRREKAYLEEILAAQSEGLGVLWLSNHTSHLDEFVLGVSMHQEGAGLAMYAAGDNMFATPSVEEVLIIGCYKVYRRKPPPEHLTTLHGLCRMMSELGMQQGIFIETGRGGARTRDGRTRWPRRLITLDGGVSGERDALIVPVAISYDRVPEDRTVTRSGSSLCWSSDLNLRTLVRGFLGGSPGAGLWRSLENIYGRCYVTMCRPWRLSELKAMHAAEDTESELGVFTAGKAILAIAARKKVMASHLVARAIVRARERGAGGSRNLAGAVVEVMAEIRATHQRLYGNEPDFEDLILTRDLDEVIEAGLRSLSARRVIKVVRWPDRFYIRRPKMLYYYAAHADHEIRTERQG